MGVYHIIPNEKCCNISVAAMETAISVQFGSVQKASLMLKGNNGKMRSHDYLGGYIREYKCKDGNGKRFPVRILKDLRNIGFDYTPFLKGRSTGTDESSGVGNESIHQISIFDENEQLKADYIEAGKTDPIMELTKAVKELTDQLKSMKEWRITIS